MLCFSFSEINSPSIPGKKWHAMTSPSFEQPKSTCPSSPQVRSLTPAQNAFLMMKNGFLSPAFQTQIDESPLEVARYVLHEIVSLPSDENTSFFNDGLNLHIFTLFLCPFKCPSIFQFVPRLIIGAVKIPPMQPEVVANNCPSYDQSSLANCD